MFDFNLYSALLIPAVIQGSIYSALLWKRSKSHDNKSDWFLALLCLYGVFHIAQWMLGFAGWYDARNEYSLFMFYFPFKNWFIIGPLLFYFVKTRTNSNYIFNKKDWLHFLPGLLFYAYALFCFLYDVVFLKWIKGVELAEFNGMRGFFAQQNFGILDTPLTIAAFGLLIFYIVRSIMYYNSYKSHIKNEHSNAEEVSLK
ncbi:MAG: hypothetical protein AAGK97_12825, partial [Bacteroidota bacterium]